MNARADVADNHATIFQRGDALLVAMSDALGRADFAQAIALANKFKITLEIELQFRDARKGQA